MGLEPNPNPNPNHCAMLPLSEKSKEFSTNESSPQMRQEAVSSSLMKWSKERLVVPVWG